METVFKNLVSRENFYTEQGRVMLWDNEPDMVLGFYRGFPYAIIRHAAMGHLCGYVGISKEHPWYGKCYNDLPHTMNDEDGNTVYGVHGGFTYSKNVLGLDTLRVVVVPETEMWWVGIDMAHSFDDSPVLLFVPEQRSVFLNYRTIGYVYEELVNIIRMASKEGDGVGIMPQLKNLAN